MVRSRIEDMFGFNVLSAHLSHESDHRLLDRVSVIARHLTEGNTSWRYQCLNSLLFMSTNVNSMHIYC